MSYFKNIIESLKPELEFTVQITEDLAVPFRAVGNYSEYNAIIAAGAEYAKSAPAGVLDEEALGHVYLVHRLCANPEITLQDWIELATEMGVLFSAVFRKVSQMASTKNREVETKAVQQGKASSPETSGEETS